MWESIKLKNVIRIVMRRQKVTLSIIFQHKCYSQISLLIINLGIEETHVI